MKCNIESSVEDEEAEKIECRAIFTRSYRLGERAFHSCQVVTVYNEDEENCEISEFGNPNDTLSIPIDCIKRLSWTGNGVTKLTLKLATKLLNQYRVNERHLPTKREWLKILACGTIASYNHGDIIVRRGCKLQRLYQVISGKCTIIKEDTKKEIMVLKSGELFGEVSLMVGFSPIQVISGGKEKKKSTKVYVMEAEVLQRLFSKDKYLAGKFYKFCAIIAQRKILDNIL